MNNRGWLIAVSIIVGILLSCVALPLGLLALVGADSGTTLASPAGRWREQVVEGSGSDRIVVLEVSGVIGLDAGGFLLGGQLTQRDLLSQIRQASEDERVKAVVLRVDSPGGGVVASSELHAALKELREAGKQLVVSMGDTAASGGYYIATAANKIYAHPDTFTGSLGVIISLTNLEGTYEKLGLRQLVFKSGEFKDIGSPARQPTPEESAILQSIVDQAYQGFVDVIVEGRGLPREEVLRLADGRIYTGKQARDLKLVDALGNLDDAIAEAQTLAGLSDALVVRYRPEDSLRTALLGALASSQQPQDPLGVRALTHNLGPRLEYRMIP